MEDSGINNVIDEEEDMDMDKEEEDMLIQGERGNGNC